MGRHATFPYDNSFTERKKLWKPCDTLGIINPDPGYQCITCVGYAPSQGRRCRNPIKAANRVFIVDTLEEIAFLPPDSATVISRLRTIASRALCVRYHQNQAETILEQWQDKIEAATLRNKERRYTKPARSYNRKQWDKREDASKYDDITDGNDSSESDLETEFESEQKDWRQEEKRQGPDTKKKHDARHDTDILQEQLREVKKLVAELREQLRRQRQDDREADGGSQEGDEDERKQEESRRCRDRLNEEREKREQAARKREKEQREREELEQELREKERQEKERQEKQRKEKEEQERAAHNERIRQKAEKVREANKKAERDRLQKEREEWDKTWTTYQNAWTKFKQTPPSTTPSPNHIRTTIPWPVKSGAYADVKRPAVQAFFNNALPRGLSASETAKLMRAEAAKWHPDKAFMLFRGQALSEADRLILELICHVVFEVRDEAAKGGSG